MLPNSSGQRHFHILSSGPCSREGQSNYQSAGLLVESLCAPARSGVWCDDNIAAKQRRSSAVPQLPNTQGGGPELQDRGIRTDTACQEGQYIMPKMLTLTCCQHVQSKMPSFSSTEFRDLTSRPKRQRKGPPMTYFSHKSSKNPGKIS